MKNKNYTYAVQWIDHGGPYEEPQWERHVPTALKQMGLDPDKVIVEIGGLELYNPTKGEITLYGYIETNVELPQFEGMKKSSPRWVEEISLWFYTFEPKSEMILERYDLYDFEDMLHA